MREKAYNEYFSLVYKKISKTEMCKYIVHETGEQTRKVTICGRMKLK